MWLNVNTISSLASLFHFSIHPSVWSWVTILHPSPISEFVFIQMCALNTRPKHKFTWPDILNHASKRSCSLVSFQPRDPDGPSDVISAPLPMEERARRKVLPLNFLPAPLQVFPSESQRAGPLGPRAKKKRGGTTNACGEIILFH